MSAFKNSRTAKYYFQRLQLKIQGLFKYFQEQSFNDCIQAFSTISQAPYEPSKFKIISKV